MVQVWDAKTGQRVRSFPVTQPVISQDYSSNLYRVTVRRSALCNHYLAVEKIKVLNRNGQEESSPILEIWDLGTGSIIFTQEMQVIQVRDMQWAPDCRRLATLTEDSSQNLHWTIWDIPTGQVENVVLKRPQLPMRF